jgi:hypothetical protein
MKAIQNQDGERLFDDVQCLGPPPGGICQTSSRVWTGSRLLPRWQESRTGFVGWFRIWTAWKTGQFSLRLGMSWNDSDWRGGNIGKRASYAAEALERAPLSCPPFCRFAEGIVTRFASGGGAWSPIHNSR